MSDRRDAAATSCFAEINTAVALQHGGDDVDDERRHELIERANNGGHVELEIVADVYRQGGATVNRKHTLFGDAAAMQWTGLSTEWGSPFSRNHSIWTDDSGGYVLTSTVRHGPATNEFAFEERIRLVAPWAVLAALRGQMRRFSIFWRPTGDVRETVLCSLCRDGIGNCFHYPGERIATDGGNAIVQLIYTALEPIERSWVLSPAIEATGINSIHALSDDMPLNRTEIAAAIGLDANAHDADILKKLQGMRVEATRFEEYERRISALQAENESLQLTARETRANTVIHELLRDGYITKGDKFEEMIRQHISAGQLKMAESLIQAIRERKPAVPVGKKQRPDDSQIEPALSFEDARNPLSTALSASDAFANLPEHVRVANAGMDPVEVFRWNPDLAESLGVTIAELK